jgi:hypothetical protein
VQDLRKARLVLWVDDPAAVITHDTAPFFDAFSEHITIKRFDYAQVCQMQLRAAGSCGTRQLCCTSFEQLMINDT